MSGASSVFAVVPVKDLAGTKSRLAPILNPGARAGLTLYMMGRVVAALRGAGVENVGVVSPDRIVLGEAEERGATPLRQESRGLNPALEEGRRWAMAEGASALLVLPADLPLLEPEDIRDVLGEADDETSVVISPDSARAGTNALLLAPPDALPFAFGLGSYEAHLHAARERGLDVRVREHPHLAFDLDTADDLARLEEVRRP
ncbi:MAG TPA: 2-phospho-L-lactate guanylyltransferase [Rubrobacteraceae bacterium]|nr:2-phospho-L-lactate guanylyltransferase [Rubrobacteraceae bacterium]